MPKQLVMDQTGHSTHEFDRANKVSVEEAMQRFEQLTKKGYAAATRTGQGEFTKIRAFDPNAEETIFQPQLVGG